MTTDQRSTDLKARLRASVQDLVPIQVKASVSEPLRQLQALLSSLSDEQARWKPPGGRRSIAELCQRAVEDVGASGRIARMLAQGQIPTPHERGAPEQFLGDPADVAGVRTRLGYLPAYTDELYDRSRLANNTQTCAPLEGVGDLNWEEWYLLIGEHARELLRESEELRASEAFPQV